MGDYVHYKVPMEALWLMCTVQDWEICTASPMISSKHFKWLMISSKHFKWLSQSLAGHSAASSLYKSQLPVAMHLDCLKQTAVIVQTGMMTHRRKLCPILRLVMLQLMASVLPLESTVVQRYFNFIPYDLPFFWFTVCSCTLEHSTCLIFLQMLSKRFCRLYL